MIALSIVLNALAILISIASVILIVAANRQAKRTAEAIRRRNREG